MCGIAGILGHGRGDVGHTLTEMTDTLARRGPDGQGHWLDHDAGIALGHRRLSVVDLGPNGDQPMHSHNGRYVLVYNGEIYNTDVLRKAVEHRRSTVAWRGHSDTEVLLELLAEVGLKDTLALADGMFAFALFDRKKRQLVLARDAFGEKPLFYGLVQGRLVFGSQVSALRCVPGFDPVLNHDALAQYFKYSYIPAPLSIFRGIFKLPPAHFLSLSLDDVEQGSLPEPQAYWNPVAAAKNAQNAGFNGTYTQAQSTLEQLLENSVRGRMDSDVPLGCLLSGGIDSSIVTAMMTRVSTQQVKTFCIGMQDESFNEAKHAAQVAAHLQTDHTELLLSPRDVLEAVPLMPEIYDEPFADSSQIPTYLVSKLARAQVTVALSGDGGDEVLGGYNRYIHGPKIWAKLNRIPRPLRRVAGQFLGALPVASMEQMLRRFGPAELRAGRAGEKIKKLAGLMSAQNSAMFHDRMLATAQGGETVLLGQAALPPNNAPDIAGFANQMMLADTLAYLPGDILTKVDRAAMYCSLETRTPFLNRALFDFAWSLPHAMKINNGTGKQILRDLLYKHVPRAMVDRPKAGFAVPIGRWMRGDLRDWAEAGLSETALARSGILDSTEVQRRWQEHLSGRQNHDSFLWSILMFQGWYEKNH